MTAANLLFQVSLVSLVSVSRVAAERRLFAVAEANEEQSEYQFKFECLEGAFVPSVEDSSEQSDTFVFNATGGFCVVNQKWAASRSALLKEFAQNGEIMLPMPQNTAAAIGMTFECVHQFEEWNACALLMQEDATDVVEMLRLFDQFGFARELQQSLTFLRSCGNVKCHNALLRLRKEKGALSKEIYLLFWLAPLQAAIDSSLEKDNGLTAWLCTATDNAVVLDTTWLYDELRFSAENKQSLQFRCEDELVPFFEVLRLRHTVANENLTKSVQVIINVAPALKKLSRMQYPPKWKMLVSVSDLFRFKDEKTYVRSDLFLEFDDTEQSYLSLSECLRKDSKLLFPRKAVNVDLYVRRCELDPRCDNRKVYGELAALLKSESYTDKKFEGMWDSVCQLASSRIDFTELDKMTLVKSWGICRAAIKSNLSALRQSATRCIRSAFKSVGTGELFQRTLALCAEFQDAECFVWTIWNVPLVQWLKHYNLAEATLDRIVQLSGGRTVHSETTNRLTFLRRVQGFLLENGGLKQWNQVLQTLDKTERTMF